MTFYDDLPLYPSLAPKRGTAAYFLGEVIRDPTGISTSMVHQLLNSAFEEGMPTTQRFAPSYHVLGHHIPFYADGLLMSLLNFKALSLVDVALDKGTDLQQWEFDRQTVFSRYCQIPHHADIALGLLERGGRIQFGNHQHPVGSVCENFHYRYTQDMETLFKRLMGACADPNQPVAQPLFCLPRYEWHAIQPEAHLKWSAEMGLGSHQTPSGDAYYRCRNLEGEVLLQALKKLDSEELEGGWPLRLRSVLENTAVFKPWIEAQSWSVHELDWALLNELDSAFHERSAALRDSTLFDVLIQQGANPKVCAPNGLNTIHLLLERLLDDYPLDLFLYQEQSERIEPPRAALHRLEVLTQAGVDWTQDFAEGLTPLHFIQMFGMKMSEALEELIHAQMRSKLSSRLVVSI